MDQPSLYDDDIVTWADEQAAALRALGANNSLSNAVDWENVAGEIESVGRSHVRAVESLLTQVLAHLLKRLSAPDVLAASQRQEEVVTFQIAARSRFEMSMRQRIDWNKVWKSPQEAATSGLMPYGDGLMPNLPIDNPLTPDELLAMPFEVDGALRRIAESAERPRN